MLRLARALKFAGHTVTAVAPASGQLRLMLQAAGTRVLAWPPLLEALVTRRASQRTLGRQLSRAMALAGSLLTQRWLDSLRTERTIVHLNTSRTVFLYRHPTRALCEIRDALGPPFTSAMLARLFATRVQLSVGISVANSNFTAQRLIDFGYPKDRVAVIHNGIDLTAVRPLKASKRRQVRTRERWPESVFVVACVGRLTFWKGQHLALEGFARLRQAHPNSLLVVVGEPAFDSVEYSTTLRNLAERLNISGEVVFAGFRHDVLDLIGACDSLLVSSVMPEPLGLTAIEAQALGVPVVAPAVGGPLETVAHGLTGYLYRPSDPDDLCRGLEWALDVDRLAVTAAGRARAEAMFDINSSVDRYVELYEALVGTAR